MTWNRENIGEDGRELANKKKTVSVEWTWVVTNPIELTLNEIVCCLIYELETEIQLRQFYDFCFLSNMSLKCVLASQDVPTHSKKRLKVFA